MGLLATAGVISGMGKGLEQGLNNVQGAVLNSWLLNERNTYEAERDRLNKQFETGRDTARFANEKSLLGQKTEADITAASLKSKGDLESERLKSEQSASQHRDMYGLATERAKETTAHEHRIEAMISGREDKPDTTAIAKAKLFQTDMDGERKLMETASGPALEESMKRFNTAKQHRDELLGISEPTGEPAIVRPPGMALPKAAGGSPGATAAPPAPSVATESPTVEPTRPTPLNYHGKVDPSALATNRKQLLDYNILMKRQELDKARVHGNKALQDRLEHELTVMESQQDAGRSLLDSAGAR